MGRRFILWPHLRFHAQNSVSFWQRAYTATSSGDLPALRTGDRELVTDLGILLEARGALPMARDHHQQAVDLARRAGDKRATGQFSGYLGEVLARGGMVMPPDADGAIPALPPTQHIMLARSRRLTGVARI